MSNSALFKLQGVPVGAALVLLAVSTGLRRIRAPDYWWHLSSGQWIAENGNVPHSDVFTYTVSGDPWLDIHWLFQLGLFGLQSLAGHEGVVIAKTLLVVSLVAILATIGWRRERVYLAAVGLGLMLLAANDRLLARPELTSFILLGSILALLERDVRRNDSWLYAIIPLQLLWVNTHGLFALGVVTCAIYAVGEAIRCGRGQGETARLRRLSILTGVVIPLSLASPNFIAGALYPLEQFGMIAPDGASQVARYAIAELVPIWSPGLSLTPLAAPILLSLLCAIALAANWRRATHREEHLLAFIAFFLLFAMATRNAAVFAIVAAPICIRNANEWLDRHPPARGAGALFSVAAFLLLLSASWDVARGNFYLRNNTYHEPGLGYVELFVPREASDWIERERPPGRIAHSIVFGGYLGWRLHPDYEVMVDGRLEVYGAAKLAKLALSGPGAFARLDAEYQFGSVVLSSVFDSTKLIGWLQRSPGWQLVQLDHASVLFVRAKSEGRSPWSEVDLEAPDLLPEPRETLPVLHDAYTKIRRRLLRALGPEAESR